MKPTILMTVLFVGLLQAEDHFEVAEGERQLFLDDLGIASIDNLTRTMHPPVKKGAVIRPDPTKGGAIQTRTAPFWDPDREIFRYMAEGWWESQDGLHWSRGERASNLKVGRVLYDPIEADPARRFKSFFPTQLAVSPDGYRWTVLDLPERVFILVGVVPPIRSSDEQNFSLDRSRELYIGTVKQEGPYGRSVYLTTSKDFEQWTEPELIFHADELDQELGRKNIEERLADPRTWKPLPIYKVDPSVYNVDVYHMGVFRYEGLYIGTPALYHAIARVPNYPNTIGFHLVQLVSSRDLKTWRRQGDRRAFIGSSPTGAGAYDVTQIIGPSYPLERGDELWFYYTGLKYRGTFTYVGKYPDGRNVLIPGLEADTGAICLAVLRRDGFVSLDAGETEGTLLTKSFALPAGKLWVNLDAPEGDLRVEVLDAEGKVRGVSGRLKGDLKQAEVSWQSGDISGLSGHSVSLRFRVRQARFYSYWFSEQ